jgi:heterogeneous nuclear rnp K-like protein 2
MAESPTTSTAAPSQKRPLEEPSSPQGPGDQPDAKRPALDKVIKSATPTETTAPEPTTPSNDTEIKEKPAELKDAESTQNGASQVVLPTTAESIAAITTHTTSNGNALASGQAVDESQWLHVRAIISSAEAATVIGKGGENVTMIRKHSGAKCTVSDYARGAVERILTVSGPVDAVAKVSYAFRLLYMLLTFQGIWLDYPHIKQ